MSFMHHTERHLRLWWQCALADAMRLLEYRVNFWLSVAERIASLAMVVFSLHLIYQFTDEVAGWSRAEVLVVVGVFWLFSALWDLLFGGLREVSKDIRTGTMDFILLRPVSAQFLISLRRVNLLASVNLLLGLALVVYAGNLAGARWSPWGVGAAILLGICGLTGIYALRFILVTCAFWLVSVKTLHDLLHPVFQVGQYPVHFFKGWVRFVLTFVIPVAFATTFPAQALLGTIDLRLLPLGLLLAGAALLASHHFWLFAVRHYTSASS